MDRQLSLLSPKPKHHLTQSHFDQNRNLIQGEGTVNIHIPAFIALEGDFHLPSEEGVSESGCDEHTSITYSHLPLLVVEGWGEHGGWPESP